MTQLQDTIASYLNSLGKEAAKKFGVSPQKVASWKKKPETVPFNIIELAGIWDASRDVIPVATPPNEGILTQEDLTQPQRSDWGEPENKPRPVQAEYEQQGETVRDYVPSPEEKMWGHIENHADKLYELNDRLKGTENGIQQILSLLQTGQGNQKVQLNPNATTHRIEPQMGPNGELPAFVSSGPQQSATDNLTRPSRYAGQPLTEADLDRLDPTRHNPAVDPAGAKALWMRPKQYGQDRRR